MIYLDASALVTLVVERTNAAELRIYLDAHAAERTHSSTIGFIETVRTCDRIGVFPGLLGHLLQEHHQLPMSDRVRDEAARLPGMLRSLDAIHVASAAVLGPELTALVTYDHRMADAARGAGLPVAMPGLS
ncbi:MAG: type II toxin-antitoxin system VapC family toxin [Thermocrispum sp.]